MASGTQSFDDAALTMYALLSAVNIISIDASATQIPIWYRLARGPGSKKPSRRFEPLPFGPGSLPPGLTPFFVTTLVLVTIAAVTTYYLRTRACLHHKILRRPRHPEFICPPFALVTYPATLIIPQRSLPL